MSVLFYKKPPRVAVREGPLSECANSRDRQQADKRTARIPEALSFDRMICNQCPAPCSLQDLLDYMMHVSHDAENLQFYLWMIDYFQRFRNTKFEERALSPRWRGVPPPTRSFDGQMFIGARERDLQSDDGSNRSTWGFEHVDRPATAHLRPMTSPKSNDPSYDQTLDRIRFSASVSKTSHSDDRFERPHSVRSLAAPPPVPAKDPVDRKGRRYTLATEYWQWYPPAQQPFRQEITQIINHYLAPGSPRQLNLSFHDREAVLHALRYTTHPSALRLVKRMLDSTLRNQTHPNFVRWSICNNNMHWTWALRIFAVTNITLGFVIAIVLTLSRVNRYFRILAAIEWWFGITNIIAASQGLCVLLHRMHTRQYHMWEFVQGDPSDTDLHRCHSHSSGDLLTEKASCTHHDESAFYNIEYNTTRAQWPPTMKVFGPPNALASEQWIAVYHKKPWHKKLFERHIKVQNPGLSFIQNRLVRQAEAWALIITIPLTVAFVAIPNGNFF